ncbi:MAG TPA: CheR family methyltransferase [Pyrinomonadaceae bacterium]
MMNSERGLANFGSTLFPIVGIGASAGGLQALRDFFTHMPPDNGMAFVVIMHLSPHYESQAAEVLQNTTAMLVTQVTQTVKVEPNHVYVIPPSKNLQMSDGQIIPTELEPLHAGKQVTIDLFFRTLAETHKENAVGIVLSGMGSDGTNGLKRIKEQNGFSFAQEPSEAEHSSMPMHAINSQLVDFVLPVALMPAKLIELAKNATRIKLPPETEPPAVLSQAAQDEAALREILSLLRTHTGHDFTHYRRVTVLRRISRRLQVHQLQHLAGYRDFLREHPAEEARALLKDLLISVTNFFRDHQAFVEFERRAVPAIFADKGSADQVRIWVAGCATGEEAYSLAMLLLEYAEQLQILPTIQIFATDIDEDAIRIAREGFYTETIQADVAPERLNRFFNKENGGYRIKKELRDCVLFAVHNLLKDPPFLRLDAITCRNLLIYLNRDAQRHLFELFHFVLAPGGWLLLGNSESLDTRTELFSTFDKKYRIYQAKNGRRDRVPTQNFRFTLTYPQNTVTQAKGVMEQLRIPLAAFHRKVLDQHSLASVVVDNSYEILHLSDHAGRFLRFGSGEPSHNLMKVIYPDLRIELRRILLQAGQQGKSTESARIKVELAEGVRYVRISARPVKDEGEHNYILVLFDEVEDITSESGALSQNATGPLVGLLEEELHRTKENQRATIEQYETQAEELRTSNEELQAINEELRSATEELETGKEELQSVNEEIQTVNAELKQKIDELAIANSDLQNLIISTDLATIFVDRNLSIKFYTPRAREIFNLIRFDVGRSLSDITHNLDYEGMLTDVQGVLDESSKTEREVRSSDGRWYVAQLIPYRLQADRTDGVILTFIDFTQRKLAEEEALSAKTELEQQTVYLKDTNTELEKEIRERQRVEIERGKLLRRLVLAQEEERSRIAREMHDQFGQLTVLSLKLEALKKECGDNRALCEQVEMAQAIAQQLDAEVDNLIWEMRPTALDDLGLEDALRSYIQRWAAHLGIHVEFHATGAVPPSVTLEIETVLYRIAQEALNNVAKHAQATTVAIVLERRRTQISLIVEDDGVGFDFQQGGDGSDLGLGLIGMRERSALLGGTIEIETQPTRGTTVVVRIPLSPILDNGAIDE